MMSNQGSGCGEKPTNAISAAGRAAIDLRNVSKSYGRGSGAVQALRDVNAIIEAIQ